MIMDENCCLTKQYKTATLKEIYMCLRVNDSFTDSKLLKASWQTNDYEFS